MQKNVLKALTQVALGLILLGFSREAAVPDKSLPNCLFHQHQELAKSSMISPRPSADFHLNSTSQPLTVHWTSAVTEEYAREILSYAEETWRKEFEDHKFVKPHPDGDLGGSSRLDIYINTELDPGIGGYAGFSGFVEETPRQDAYGYLVINNNIDIRIRRFVVAHELFHLSQMAYDWWEDISFMESSATWIADHVFGDENIYWRYFPFFNQEPYTALDFISIRNPFQYGAALFTTYLDERFGSGDGTFIRRIWENSVQDDIENEPDFLDSAADLLPSDTTLADAYHEFGTWRLLTGSRSHLGFFKEGALWDERMDPWFELDTRLSSLPVAALAQKPVGPLAHAFLRLANDEGYAGTLKGRIESSGSVFRISHLAVTANSIRSAPIATIHGAAAVDFKIQSQAGDSEHFIILTNITDGSYDADTSPWDGTGFTFSFMKE